MYLWQDIRYGVRMMMGKPIVTLAAILSLGLGIGSCSIIYTWLRAVYLRPLPGVADSGRLVTINSSVGKREGYSNSFLDYAYYRDHAQVFDGVLGHEFNLYNVSSDRTPELIAGSPVTGNYFDVLRVRPHLGRTFRPDEDQVEGRDAVAVISYALWQRRFASDPAVAGKSIHVNGVPFTIIGVAPEGFAGVYGGLGQDLWMPMQMHNRVAGPSSKVAESSSWFQIMARLRPGVSFDAAAANLEVLVQQMRSGHHKGDPEFGARLYPLHKAQRGLQSGLFPFVSILAVVVALVLLIACLNVANLQLARAAERTKEITVRLALGASTGRLFRQLLTESVMLAALGGGLGLLLTAVFGDSLGRLIPITGIPLGLDMKLDFDVVLFLLAISVACGIGFGLAPAWLASRSSIATSMKEQAGGVVGAGRQWLRGGLVVAQIALSLMALVGTGLFGRSLRNALAASPGFQVDHALVAQVNPDLSQYTAEQGRRFYAALLDQLRRAPGVQSATVTSFLPLSLSGGGSTRRVEIEGQPTDSGRPLSIVTDLHGSAFFSTMGIPLLMGREFGDQDGLASPRVAVVNETFAKQFLAGRDPIGARLKVGRDEYSIVGVSRDHKYRRLNETPRPYLFLPIQQAYAGSAILVVRGVGTNSNLLPVVRQVLSTLDPGMPLAQPMSLAENVAASFAEQRITTILLSAFSLVAGVLAIVGLYGIMSSFVGARIREIGLRMALGADRRGILSMVMRRGFVLVAIGVSVGLVFTALLTRMMVSVLYGVGAFDLPTFAGVAAVLIAAGAIACWIPARRAASVDPMIALRFE